MALASLNITSCLCCSLLTGCILSGILIMFLYFLAFALELWWIVEAEVQLSTPAYLLTLIYFFLSVLSVFVLVGLRTRRTRLILAWMLVFLLSVLPEAGMVLYMAIYFWNGGSYGIIELGLWVIRALVSILGTISLHSLYSYWRDEKSVLKSLQELNVTPGGFHSHEFSSEYQQLKRPSLNYAFERDERLIRSPKMAVTKYTPTLDKSLLKRSSSSVSSRFVTASRFDPGFLSAEKAAGSRLSLQTPVNEFDAAKFHRHNGGSLWDISGTNLGSVNGGLQWYRPRSLINLYDSSSDEYEDNQQHFHENHILYTPQPNKRTSFGLFNHNKPPRRGKNLAPQSRAFSSSLGALDFDLDSDELDLDLGEVILRGGVGPCHYFNNNFVNRNNSKASLAQFSDHIDKYRDVAL